MANKYPPPQAGGMMGELQSEVSVEAAPLLQFITRHVALIVGVVLLLIAAIVATGVYQWYTAKTVREAQLSLGKVLTSTTGEAKIQALEALLPDMPGSMREGVQLEIALAALLVENYEKSAAAYGAVAAMDKGLMGAVAAMDQADALLRGDRAAEALSVLEELERTAPETMRVMVWESLGSAAEAAGKPERAAKAYESLVAHGDAVGADLAYYRARIRDLTQAPATAPDAAPAAAPEQAAPATAPAPSAEQTAPASE